MCSLDCNRNKADVIESSFQRYFSGWNYVWFCCAAAARAAWFNSRPASKGSKEEPAGACQGQSIEPNMPLFPGYCADGQKRCWDKPISQRRGEHWPFIYLWKTLDCNITVCQSKAVWGSSADSPQRRAKLWKSLKAATENLEAANEKIVDSTLC